MVGKNENNINKTVIMHVLHLADAFRKNSATDSYIMIIFSMHQFSIYNHNIIITDVNC